MVFKSIQVLQVLNYWAFPFKTLNGDNNIKTVKFSCSVIRGTKFLTPRVYLACYGPRSRYLLPMFGVAPWNDYVCFQHNTNYLHKHNTYMDP